MLSSGQGMAFPFISDSRGTEERVHREYKQLIPTAKESTRACDPGAGEGQDRCSGCRGVLEFFF